MSKFEFETHCFDGQKCGAPTTGCVVGQCLRKNWNGNGVAHTPKFVFLLNAMENASHSERPAERGYAGHRAKVLDYVARLERELADATRDKEFFAQRAEELTELVHGDVPAVVYEGEGS